MSETTTSTKMEFIAAVETWLNSQFELEPGLPITWTSCGTTTAVRNAEHLAVLISMLDVDRYGVLERRGSSHKRWGQTMRTTDGWIVEVHDGTDEDFAQRVYRGGAYQPHSETSSLYPVELWGSGGSADVLWAWLAGRLPAGCSRTLDYLSSKQRQQYGVGPLPNAP